MAKWTLRRRRRSAWDPSLTVVCILTLTVILLGNLYLVCVTISGVWTDRTLLTYVREDFPGVRGEASLLREAHLRKLMDADSFRESRDRDGMAYVDCEEIRKITNLEYVASGWTKIVHKGVYGGKQVAVKRVNVGGHHMKSCLGRGTEWRQCFDGATAALVREIRLLRSITHENIIKLIGFCVPENDFTGQNVTIVTELGDPVDLIRLLQLPWEDRLRVAYGVLKLVDALSKSPVGSLVLNDFRRQQFVLVDGDVKLTDLDDVGYEESQCVRDDECVTTLANKFNVTSECRESRCKGLNEKKNIFNAGRHFTTFLLTYDAPTSLTSRVNSLVYRTGNASAASSDLVRDVSEIVRLYRTTQHNYRNTPRKFIQDKYSSQANSDVSAKYDYRCRYRVTSTVCHVSVASQSEAESLCSTDSECAGFVMTSQHTWTGRRVVYLKTQIGQPIPHTGYTVWVKPAKSN